MHSHGVSRVGVGALAVASLVALFWVASPGAAIEVVIDYRYDTNHFFDTNPGTTANPGGATGALQARNALAAVAARYSSVITSSLGVVNLVDDGDDGRIGFSHPGTGTYYEVSAAASVATDALVAAGASVASEYRNGLHINANQAVVYAGARSLPAAGEGGTGTGTNWMDIFDDPNSHLNRGFNVGYGSLPVWGGAVTFDNDGSTNWHFDHTTAAPASKADFYSIALHEVGHVLGLATNWDDFEQYVSGSNFLGPHAVAALNADNGTSVTAVPLESTTNRHWNDNSDGGSYRSYIFRGGNPNLVGTVGLSTLQDLLMEPTANFVYPTILRFELTNIDVGALEDIGWDIVEVTLIPGDANNDGHVDQLDAQVLAAHWGLPGGWDDGDFSGNGTIGPEDASIMAANWGFGTGESGAVPEPSIVLSLLVGLSMLLARGGRWSRASSS